jgi:hypothetical protein
VCALCFVGVLFFVMHFRVFSSLGVAVLPMRVVCPCFGS